MKKSTKIVLCTSAVLIALGLVLTLGGLAAGAKMDQILNAGLWDLRFYEHRTSAFSDDGRYVIPAEGVREMDINWWNGTVSIETYPGQEILVEESCRVPLGEKTGLTYEVEHGTLRIFSSPEQGGIFFTPSEAERKDLRIQVPEQMDLAAIDFEASGGELRMQEVAAGKVSIDVVDGDVSLEYVDLGQLEINAATGDVTMKAVSVEEVGVSVVNGSCHGEFQHCPRRVSYDGAAGDVELWLPEDSQFTVEKSGIEGEFQSEFTGVERGDSYVVGDGTSSIEIDTVSGALRIWKLRG